MSEPLIYLTSGEEIDGEIFVTVGFDELSPIARLDLLKDWQSVLLELYNQEHAKAFKSLYEPHGVCAAAIKRRKPYTPKPPATES